MTTENEDEEIPITIKEKTASQKKEKNPKRVAGGKKGVEARKLKEELKRKEAELLRKEIFELKQRESTSSQITKETSSSNKETSSSNKGNSITQKHPLLGIDYKLLLFLSIGISGLGLIIYNQRNQVVSTPIKHIEKKEYKEKKENKEKKEIDPFEF